MPEKESALSLLQKLIVLSVPMVLEEVLSTVIQYADTAMVGRLGEQATAAVSTTTTVTWLIGAFIYAAGAGILSLVSQAYGADDRKRGRALAVLSVKITLLTGSVLTAVCLALSPFIPTWMGAAPEIRREAAVYFAIIALPLVLRTASGILGSAVRATQNTRTPMLVSLAANIINIGLDYVFIYPCGLGVTGAAVASAIAFSFGGIMDIIVFLRTPFLNGRDAEKTGPDKTLRQDFLKISLPVMASSVTSCLGYVVFAALVSRMGTTVFAAHSIAVNAETIFYIPGYGLRTATAALVGAAIGEKSAYKLRHYSGLATGLTLGMMAVNGFLLYIAAGPLMSLFTPSKEVIALGTMCLKIVAFTEPFYGLMVVMEGVFYGTGNTAWPFFVETLSMWGIRILFTALGLNLWGFSLSGVWFCMIADNIAKALLLTLPVLIRPWRQRLLQIDLQKENPEAGQTIPG